MKFYGIDMVSEFKPSTSNYFEILERNLISSHLIAMYRNGTPNPSIPVITDNNIKSLFLFETHFAPRGFHNNIDHSNTTAVYGNVYKERLYSAGAVIQTNTLYNYSNVIERILVSEMCNTDQGSTLVYISFDDGSTWTGGDLVGWTITNFTGTSNGGGNYRLKLKFSRSLGYYYWTTLNTMNTFRGEIAGAGDQNSSLNFGGISSGGYSTVTEIWDGLNWAITSSLNTARSGLAGCGTTSDALSFGGETATDKYVNNTEIWDGSIWATTSALNQARFYLAGCGTTSDALSFGGGTTGVSPYLTNTEIWDGSTWATTTALNTARMYISGCGTTDDALSFGGNTGGNAATTEIWNGSAWATTSALNTVRSDIAGCGTTATAFSFGGSYITEKWGGASWTTANMPSMSFTRYGLAGVGTTTGALASGGASTYYMGLTERYSLASQLGFGVKIN